MPPHVDARALMPITSRPDVVMVRGEGSYLWDDEGRRFLDFVQGWAVNCLGHAPEEIAQALAEQGRRLLTPSPAYYNEPALGLATRLAELSGLEHVFFCNSGAEANEGAIKLARKWGQLHRSGGAEIITTAGSFHGRTLATMAASGKPGFDAIFPPKVPGFVKVPFDDVSAIEAAVGAETCAVMLEPIQGEGGVVVPRPGYYRALRELCDEKGVLLIFDEIQTGVGRTGKLFAHQWEDTRPDIMTLGKGLGGGVPLAALLATRAASCFLPGDQGGTYNGNPLMTAVGMAVIDVVSDPAFLARVRAASQRLVAGLEDRARRLGTRARGRGLLVALQLPRPAATELKNACFDLGLLVNDARPDLVRLVPSLRVSDEEIDHALSILDAGLSRLGLW